jgi:Zn-dependent peptidase ImmA (M78 family)
MSYSDDALNYKDKICYNDKQPFGRISFSLMHELGHILLHHNDNHNPKTEQEANIFASNMLAPRMAIHYAECKNQTDVVKLFGLTNEAAQYAFDDYRRWHRITVYQKMNSFDTAIYNHFYNENIKKFIYSIKKCVYCGEDILNSSDYICVKCSSPKHIYQVKQETDTQLLIAENQWLYGGI